MMDRAKVAVGDALACFETQRIKADVVADGGDRWRFRGEGDELRRFRRGHRQRFFTDDVLARRQRLFALLEVIPIRRRQVDDPDEGIMEQVLVGVVGLADVAGASGLLALLRRRTYYPAHRPPQPAQRLDMNRA